MVGSVYKGVYRHINMIMNKWEGETVTVNRETLDLDKMGKVIGKTSSTFTILGSIGSIPLTNENSVIGWLDD